MDDFISSVSPSIDGGIIVHPFCIISLFVSCVSWLNKIVWVYNELVWRVDAGLNPSTLNGTSNAVFVSMRCTDWLIHSRSFCSVTCTSSPSISQSIRRERGHEHVSRQIYPLFSRHRPKVLRVPMSPLLQVRPESSSGFCHIIIRSPSRILVPWRFCCRAVRIYLVKHGNCPQHEYQHNDEGHNGFRKDSWFWSYQRPH